MWAHLADRPSSLLRTVPHATPPYRVVQWYRIKMKMVLGAPGIELLAIRRSKRIWAASDRIVLLAQIGGPLARSKRTFAAKDRIVGDQNELLPPRANGPRVELLAMRLSEYLRFRRHGWDGDQNKFVATKDRRIGSFCWRSDRYEHFPPRFESLEIKMNFCRHGFAKGQGPKIELLAIKMNF